MELFIRPDGTIQYVYTEELDLTKLGLADVRRASHVEPSFNGSQWTADMHPVGGPVLGPFANRSEALKAETEWLSDWLAGRTIEGGQHVLRPPS